MQKTIASVFHTLPLEAQIAVSAFRGSLNSVSELFRLQYALCHHHHTLTSRLSCSLAKLSNQDLYSSTLSPELFTSCGRSIRHGNPRCSTDSTATAQSLRVITPAGMTWPVELPPQAQFLVQQEVPIVRMF